MENALVKLQVKTGRKMAWKCLALMQNLLAALMFFSAVNYRGIPRQLTAAGFQIPRQLTAEGAKAYFTCVSQPSLMCEQQFSNKCIIFEVFLNLINESFN